MGRPEHPLIRSVTITDKHFDRYEFGQVSAEPGVSKDTLARRFHIHCGLFMGLSSLANHSSAHSDISNFALPAPPGQEEAVIDTLRDYFYDSARQDLLRHKSVIIGRRGRAVAIGQTMLIQDSDDEKQDDWFRIRLDPELFLPGKYRAEDVDSVIKRASRLT